MRIQNTFYALAIGILLSIAGCAKHETIFPLMGTNCDNNPAPDQKALAYLEHPDAIDTTCSGDLQRAEKEFAEGKLAFSLYVGERKIRYHDELEKLCKAQGLSLNIPFFGCLYFPGQTKGCYEAFMDQKIIERYGKDFKCQLINKADSIFLTKTIVNDDVVHTEFCDTFPVIPDKFHGNWHLVSSKDGKPYDINRMDKYVDIPNFQLHIVIEKDGTITRLSKADKSKIPFGSDSKYVFKDEVIKRVFDFIQKEYSSWKPGQIKGVPVRTIFTMEIFLGEDTN